MWDSIRGNNSCFCFIDNEYMNLHSFYRKFEDTNKDDRFQPIDSVAEPTSLFVIFQQLTQVRAQKKYFEDRERHLLNLAEEGFRQLNN